MKLDEDKKFENFENFLRQNKPLPSAMNQADKSILLDRILANANQRKLVRTRPGVFISLAKKPAVSIAASFIIVFGVILFAFYSDMQVDLFHIQQEQSVNNLKTVDDAQSIESFLVQSFEPWGEEGGEFSVETTEFESDYVAYFLQ